MMETMPPPFQDTRSALDFYIVGNPARQKYQDMTNVGRPCVRQYDPFDERHSHRLFVRITKAMYKILARADYFGREGFRLFHLKQAPPKEGDIVSIAKFLDINEKFLARKVREVFEAVEDEFIRLNLVPPLRFK